MILIERFIYKKWEGITALLANFTDFTYKKHSHEEYALGVTLSGVQKYYLDGSFELSYPHGVTLFNPEQIHDGMAKDKSGLKYVILYLKPNLFMELLDKKDIVRFSSPIIYNYKVEQSILNLSNAILSACDDAMCNELLLTLANNFSDVDLTKAYKKDDIFTKKAKEMIYYSGENILRLGDICKEFNMSKYKFIRLFKANTALTPYQFFLNRKITLAKQLIEKNRDIYSVVADCAFVDLSHLNRHFKRAYGVTAFEYLNLIST